MDLDTRYSRKKSRSRSVSSKRSDRRRRRSYSRSVSYSSHRSDKRHHSHRRRKHRRRHHRKHHSSSDSGRDESQDSRRSRSRTRSLSEKRDRHEYRTDKKRSYSIKSEKSVDSNEGLTEAQIEEKKELERLTRDARTVFVSQLQVKVSEKDVKKFFERTCKVKNVVLIKDRFNGKSKGYGYVELRSLEDVPVGLQLNNQKFVFPDGKEGFPVLVKASEAEKNFTHFLEKKTNTGTVTYSVNNPVPRQNREKLRNNPSLSEPWDDKIEIKNLHPDVSVSQIKELCKPFGVVKDIDLVLNSQGKSTGQCFVEFEHKSDARLALRELDGIRLLEYRLKVYKMQKGQTSKLKGTSRADVDRLAGYDDGRSFLFALFFVDGASGVGFNNSTWRLEADEINAGRFGGIGVTMNSSQKINLMTKLAGGIGEDMLLQSKSLAEPQKGTVFFFFPIFH